ncbi:hypothetical protein BLNAU_13474 [Blattamonas nauphoetae]|uniref:Uncharacterized protein n=1 Tax=Blattamonas nauphoetae TaxID=2049346 RepID=A0ABQ9XJF3_9EUKA|nr:hypothetical protein BLNAU_13474 [Blattamonas nauphoetae]
MEEEEIPIEQAEPPKFWTPEQFGKRFDWLIITKLMDVADDALFEEFSNYFEIERVEEHLEKAMFIDFCVYQFQFMREQSFSIPTTLYLMNLLFQLYIDSGVKSLDDIVNDLQTDLLLASSVNTEQQATVIRLQPPPPPQEVVEPEPEVEEKGAKKGAAKKEAPAKAAKTTKKKEAEKVQEAPPEEEEEHNEAPKDDLVEVVMSTDEIDAVITHITLTVFRHYRLHRRVMKEPRNVTELERVHHLVTTPLALPPHSESQLKPPDEEPDPSLNHVETDEEKVIRLINEAIAKHVQNQNKELTEQLLQQKDVILKKVKETLVEKEIQKTVKAGASNPTPEPKKKAK